MTFQMIYYSGMFILSFILTLIYIFLWHKHFDVHMTSIFILVPVANLAYLLTYSTHVPEATLALLKFSYIGGCFLPWLTTMCVLRMCNIPVSRLIKMLTISISSTVYAGVLTIGYSNLFYKNYTIKLVGEKWVQEKEYGPLHTVHYICMASYLIADLAALIYTYRKKKQVSRRIIFLLFMPIPITMLGYAANGFFSRIGCESMPMSYCMALVVYLLIARRMVLYNVSEMVIESEVQSGDSGFITFDSKRRYLGSNETAKAYMPQLLNLTVDKKISNEESLKDTVISWLDRYIDDPENGQFLYIKNDDHSDRINDDEKIYMVNVSDLYDGRKKCGYQIHIKDDTKNQKYIRLLDRYNTDLQAEVAAKTQRIVEMHDRLIMGMAAMVESRDNSTGGHIRRTSQGVRFLIEAIMEEGSMKLSDEFCRNIIKAAPMHDLGKIAVDDAILRKPGRFTPEEFEKMKAHAAEGARIVHNILADTDDEDFRKIAENVAHYHHERIDGSGYPDGLKGDEIPLEARIMAIADVYDALVSKRVYKEKFTFEKADSIILEGMGTQFDERLKKYYISARPNLEEFYAAE